jgi:hypothetical protein
MQNYNIKTRWGSFQCLICGAMIPSNIPKTHQIDLEAEKIFYAKHRLCKKHKIAPF